MKSETTVWKTKVLSARLRKAAVVSMYLGYIAFAALWHVSRTRHANTLAGAAVGMLLCSLAAFGVLYGRTGYWHWSHEIEKRLDEREVSARNQAYRLAFMTYVSITFLALVYCSTAADFPLFQPSRQIDMPWVVWGSLLLGLTLPSAILAWIDRPISGDE